jgi:hypothetical protein
MALQKQSLLPKEYQQVEWIKTGSGSNAVDTYVLTGIANANIADVVVQYKVLSTYINMNQPMIITSYAYGSKGPAAPWAAIGGRTSSGDVLITPRHTAPWNDISDTFTISYPTGAPNYLRIGGWSDVVWTAEGAYYFVTVIGTNDMEIAKFIPCYRKSDNIAGFYDIIRNGFYSSNGKVAFIAGPNV